ncbi:MAG TPA: PucR family transcriptional regulator ligand-binding domain-containing protein [Streptosporangiaceae bacterium]|nr:PucR family transcriptional regulator ligand-binding domain-containing protein [Streptosporangiaceae bacterium]
MVPPPEQRRDSSQVPYDALTVRELLGQEAMRGARLIAGAEGLGRLIRRLNVMTVPNIVRWTKQEEFLLTTGYPLPREPAEFGRLVAQLAANGLAGLGVKLDEYLSEVPDAVVEVADAACFPVVVIPPTAPLDDVLSQAFETIVNRQAAALAKRQEIHETLLGVALTGGGLGHLLDELAMILRDADVVICDPAGRQLAATTWPDLLGERGFRDASGSIDTSRLIAGVHEDEESGDRWAVGVIRAGAMQHGFVLAVGARDALPPAVAGPAVEQAALVAALEITRDLAVLAVEQQFAANALHDLITSTPADVDDAIARAARFRWDLQRPLAVLVARHGDGAEPAGDSPRPREPAAVRSLELWTSAIRSRDAHAAVAGFATELVAVVGVEDPVALARKVQADLTAATRAAYSVGVSQVSAGPRDIPRLYEEARVALHIGRRLSGSGAVTGFSGLGLYRLINSVSESELQVFVRETLGPVLDLPEPGRSDLLKTLAVLLDTRFNIAESARVLHYHYNTMRYRVGKLERLLGVFADDAQAALRIGVALQILRMYEISSDARKSLA